MVGTVRSSALLREVLNPPAIKGDGRERLESSLKGMCVDT